MKRRDCVGLSRFASACGTEAMLVAQFEWSDGLQTVVDTRVGDVVVGRRWYPLGSSRMLYAGSAFICVHAERLSRGRAVLRVCVAPPAPVDVRAGMPAGWLCVGLSVVQRLRVVDLAVEARAALESLLVPVYVAREGLQIAS